MRTKRSSHDPIRQNGDIVKKPEKHDSNLQKNSTLYFQIGLIMCLLMTYGLFEMKFETVKYQVYNPPPITQPKEIDIPIIKMEKPTKEEPVVQKNKPFSNDYDEVPDDTPDNPIEPTILDPVVPDVPAIDPDALPNPEKKPEDDNVPINFVQKVPVYPGCEKFNSNDDLRKCMSEKISKLIQRNFNTSVGVNYGLSGQQKINVAFKIDKTGQVTNIKTRSPHPKLDEEAERVINKMPVMTPGKQNNKNVGVLYYLPITIQIQD